jgi:DNA-binding IclR family transcriptional regulator
MPTVLTLEKSLSLLEAIVRSPQGLGTRALAKEFGLNVATVHNIAMTFVQRGYLRQDEQTRHFHAGLRLHLLGRAPASRQPLVAAARRVTQQLSASLNESVMFVAFEGGHRFTNLAFAPSRQALRVQEPEDMGAFAHCTAAGKILLAHLDEARLSTFLADHPLERHTASTITSRAILDRELAQTRARGFAQTRDELCEGISAYAVPVRDPWGAVFAAIGASAPSVRMTKAETIKATLAGLHSAAEEIEAFLALTEPVAPPNASGADKTSAKRPSSR